MIMNPEIFREYDIRGVVGKDFDNDFAYQLGRALATLVRLRKKNDPVITIGHDARLSSPEIVHALSQGIQASGGKVILLGLITTPISYFSTFTVPEVNGALMVTGSHNPPEYNGFKISVGPTTIFGKELLELQKIINSATFDEGSGTETSLDIFPSYLHRYAEEFGQIKDIKIVLDCGNGAAGCIARKLYNAVGLNPVILFEEPDGTFPNHHPDPTVEENLDDLKKAVSEHSAMIGIGFDGDADRIGVVDHEGTMILGDELIVLCSRQILKDNPGQKIIGDVKCSDRMYEDIKKHGGIPIMWKTGHSLVKKKIIDENAPFGGELSGHIFFSDRNYGYDDALYAGLRVVEILAKSGKTIKELLADLPSAYNTPEIRIDTTEEKKHTIVKRLIEEFGQGGEDFSANLIDGIRISYKDGWALARASNTQPVLVLRFEASTPENLQKIQSSIESIVNPLL